MDRGSSDVLAEVLEAAAGLDVAGGQVLAAAWSAGLPGEDVVARGPQEVLAALRAHLEAGAGPGGDVRVACREPGVPGAGAGGALDIVAPDAPYLVDSVWLALRRAEAAPVLVVHPVLQVARRPDGSLAEVLCAVAEGAQASGDPGTLTRPESWVHVEVEGPTDLGRLSADVQAVLAEVAAVAHDAAALRTWLEARAAALEDARNAAGASPLPVRDDAREAAALLRWAAEGNVVALAAQTARPGPDGTLRPVDGSALGLLARGGGPSGDEPALPSDAADASSPPSARTPLLTLARSPQVSRVVRGDHFDVVRVLERDEHGEVAAEHRLLGLLTRRSSLSDPAHVPVVRRRVAEVRRRAGLPPGGHDDRRLADLLAGLPRGELFQASADQLLRTALGVLALGQRRRVRLFPRVDTDRRFVSCLVYVPRDRYGTAVRTALTDVLMDAYDAVDVTHDLSLADPTLARLHLVLHTPDGATRDVDVEAVTSRLEAVTRTWADALAARLDGEGARARLLAEAFPPSYREDFSVETAREDLATLRGMAPRGDLALTTYRPRGADAEVLRSRLLSTRGPLALSDLVPAMEDLGVRVTDERPHRVSLPDRPPAWLYDLGLRLPAGVDADAPGVRERFHEAFLRAWAGRSAPAGRTGDAVAAGVAGSDRDGLDRLVLRAGLSWWQVGVLRAYARWMRQAGSTATPAFVVDTLCAHPDVAADLVGLFEARFDPDARLSRSREQECDARAADLSARLDAVPGLDADRVLRGLLRAVLATTRTNRYLPARADGSPRPLALKLDPAGLPDLPRPRPAVESFVTAPHVEGVHLRGGAVARGGLRWSDRGEDFRTEVLGLAKAQAVKNAVIVPVGAKGGFVVRRPAADPGERREQGQAAYRDFVDALLDLVDDLRDGDVVTPERVVRHDGDDTYLVVAADKGTATFSDLANSVAREHGFWLDDAFASGGSAGYDHKAMGITARGAWVSVRHHLREVGLRGDDVITCVGIGDMSGDVFGNGMLESDRLALVAAFDHRHVFLDPDPDPAVSAAERRRLFEVPRSSWEDYDASLVSDGGGVHRRDARSVRVSPQVRRALGLPRDVERLSGDALVQAVLRAPVHLLWNGGIGTYVKAHDESHADVGDRATDAVRVDARDLRCRSVGEGGNLGLTQRGRVEAAAHGVHLFTDAVDNSAGVDCSDHEVNLKILLRAAVDDGALVADERDPLLASLTDAVAASVLADNAGQVRALANATAAAPAMLDVHTRLLRGMETAGELDRGLEALPDDVELERRASAGTGLLPPELAVLLAYVKNSLFAELLGSPVPDEPFALELLDDYFPDPLPSRFAAQVRGHRLRRELAATRLANRFVDRAGLSAVHRLREETGASPAAVVRAHAVALAVLDALPLWRRAEAVDAQPEVVTRVVLLVRRAVERVTRWFLRTRPETEDAEALVAEFREAPRRLAVLLPGLMVPEDTEALEAQSAELVAAGVASDVADAVVALEPALTALAVQDASSRTGRDFDTVAGAWFAVGDQLVLDWVRESVVALPRTDRWRALARDALREDLYAVRQEAVEQALAEGGPSADGAAAVQGWLHAREEASERARRLLGELRRAERTDAAAVTVALREVRTLLRLPGSGGHAREGERAGGGTEHGEEVDATAPRGAH